MKRVFGILVLAVCALGGAYGQTVWSGDGPWETNATVDPGTTHWYQLPIADWQHGFKVTIDQFSVASGFTIKFRKGQPPVGSACDWAAANRRATRAMLFTFDDSAGSVLSSGDWYFTVVPARACSVRLTVERVAKPSTRQGMGATVYGGGTTFRTWAPFASSVVVAGDFDGWNGSAAKLVSEGNGYWSLDVRSVGDGSQYKYVLTNGNQTLWRKDSYSRWVSNSAGNSRVLDFTQFNWTAQGYSTPSWDKSVIYEMHVGTFNDQPGGGPGTFDSAIQRLDDLQDLGVNVLELMPIAEFPGDFSWGYNPSDPFAVESAYGGPEKFQKFVDEAHKRGIAVILDMVHNHYGPSDLGLWQYDGWSQNGYGGVFFYNDGRAVTPWGNTRPDFGRGEVRQYIRDNAMMWAEKFQVDGFRWDSTLNIRTTNWGDNPDGWSLMQWVNNEIDATQPWKIDIAEDMQGNPWLTKSTGAGGAGFDSQWSAGFVHPVRGVLTQTDDANRNMWDISGALNENFNGDWLQRVIYTESHDEDANGHSRLPQEIDPGNPGSWYARKRSTLGAVLTLTAPGIPMLFQGQEVLEDGYFSDTDPVDWSKETTYAGIRQLYKDLIAMRKNAGGITAGLTGPNTHVFHVNNNAKVVAFHRWKNGGPGDDVVVLMNFSNTSFDSYRIGMPRAGMWNVVFNSDWNGYSADYSNQYVADAEANQGSYDGLAQSASFRLPAYSAVILVQRPGGRISGSGSVRSGSRARARGLR